jgi:hypothetical protein
MSPSEYRSQTESSTPPKGVILPFALATPPSSISKTPLKRIRSPPSKGFPRAKVAPAATLIAKPSKVSVLGDRGINRAIGIISFLTLFFKSSNISIPSFYLAIDTLSLDIFLSFLERPMRSRLQVYELLR